MSTRSGHEVVVRGADYQLAALRELCWSSGGNELPLLEPSNIDETACLWAEVRRFE